MIDAPTPFAGRPRARPAAPAAGVLVILAILAAAACATPPLPSGGRSLGTAPPSAAPVAVSPIPSGTPASTPSPGASPAWPAWAGGLVIAPREGRDLALVRVDRSTSTLAPPPRPIRALRGGDRALVAVLDDGSVAVASVSGSAVAWRSLSGVAGTAAAALDPSGESLALLPADRVGTGRPLRLVTLEIGSGRRRVLDVPSLEANGGPSWLADGRIALRALAAGERDVLALVDASSGRASTRPFDGVDVVGSADGRSLAYFGQTSLTVGRLPPSAPVAVGVSAPDRAWTIGSVALDATGERLAVAWDDEDRRTQAIELCRRATAWACEPALVTHGNAGSLVAWLG